MFFVLPHSCTPLHTAVSNGKIKAVEVLIANGANISIRNQVSIASKLIIKLFCKGI